MKSIFKTAVVSAVAAAFVASVAIAGGGQQPGGRGRGGPMGAVMADLTNEQREKIKAIHEAQRDAGQNGPADFKLRQALELELLADAPNDQTIDTLKQQLAAANVEQLSRHIAVQKQVSQVLTPEQRAKARERIAQGGRGLRGDRGKAGKS